MAWWLFLIIFYIVAVVIFHVYVRYLSAYRYNFDPKYPPVVIEPWYCPFLGPILSILNVEDSLKKWRTRYGPNFTVLIFGKYVTFITKYVDLKKYYHATEEMLSLTKGAQIILGSAYPEYQYMIEYSATPYLHNIMTPRYLRSMVSNFETVADDYFNENNGQFWTENGDEVVIDLFEFMYRFIVRTNSINFTSSRIYKNHVEELIKLFGKLDIEKTFTNPVINGIRKLLGIKSEKDLAWEHWIRLLMPDIERCLKMIENNIEPNDGDIIYETVKYSKEELEKRGEPFTSRLVAFLVYSTFLPAQLNTYTSAAFMILEWIRHEHDEIGQRIKEEIDRAPPMGEITMEYLNSMEYVQACIYEVLRMRVDSQLSFRHAGQDVSLSDNKFIPLGNLVVTPVTSAKDLYLNPKKFDPERHLIPREEMKADPYRALPFGRGKHPCTGERYVKMQIKVLLIYLSKICKIELMPESRNYEATINKKQLVGLTRPTKPVYVKISKRK
jgi:cytochrome P450